jgi:hypothetical protein
VGLGTEAFCTDPEDECTPVAAFVGRFGSGRNASYGRMHDPAADPRGCNMSQQSVPADLGTDLVRVEQTAV